MSQELSDAAKDAVDATRKLLSWVQRPGDTPPDQVREERLDAIRTARDALEKAESAMGAPATPVPGGVPTLGGAEATSVGRIVPARPSQPQSGGIAEFFNAVGDGMIQAQRALDAESRTYLTSARASSGHVPESVFRIPRVNAEFHFGFDKSRTSGVNAIVVSRDKTEQETMRQRVSFEVVATPPPPGWAGQTPPMLVRSPAERASIRDYLQRIVQMGAVPDATAAARGLVADFDRVLTLIWPEGAPDGGTAWLLLLPREGGGSQRLACLLIDADTGAVLESHSRVEDVVKRVRAFLTDRASQQARIELGS